jgi:ACS family hexuronate transporter-like MFS transporter
MEAPPLSRRAAWTIAAVATLAMSVSYVDRQVLAALAPTVREALSLDHAQYGWLTSAFSMAYLVMAPVAGAWIDRTGARRGLVVSVLVWSAVAAAHGLAFSFVSLFALRVLLGASEAPSFPAAAQAASRALPPQSRAAGIGMLFTGSSIGAMIAPPLAVWLKQVTGSFRLAFVFVALLGLLWIPAWVLATRSPAARRALDPTSKAAPSSSAVERPSYRALLADRAVHRAALLVVASAPGIMFVLLWFSQYLVGARGVPQDAIGQYLWVPPLAFDLGSVSFGAMASRRDARGIRWPKPDLVMGAALLSAALALVPLAGSAWGAVVFASVSMAGGGGLYALLTSEMLANIDRRLLSSAGGLTAATQSLVHIVASPLVGAVVDRTHSYDGVLVTLGLLVVPAVACWHALPQKRVTALLP